ncbi:AMP-binding protein [Chryseobacterium sp. R2ACT005]|uniref:AMP-binding protein n=1 Tax=Chryseobacterium sp. R2ACT005 TaxID=3416668 RepID=UPI003CFA9C8B
MNTSRNIIKNLLLYNNENQILYDLNSLSGKEIAEKIITVATSLRSTGKFGCGDRVILIMNDSPEFIYSFLSLISIGCIPVPLNPLIQDSELEYILLDSKATGVIIDNHQYLRLYHTIHSSYHIINDCIIVNNPSVKEYGSINYLQKFLSPQNFPAVSLELEFEYAETNPVAFWQYTSGTTGNPKAVQHRHLTMLTNTELFAQKTLEIAKEDIILSVSKMFFGYGLGNSLFFPLLTGASVIIDEKWFTVDYLKKNIRLYKPTILFGTPKVYSEILHQHENFSKNEFNSIRLFISAGSSLPESIIREWKAVFDKTIINGIGSTEIGHIFMCNHQLKEQSKNSSLGLPVPGYHIKISRIDTPDETIENYGEIGELCIYPPKSTLSSYWEKEETNKIKYKEGWYFSGDLCSQNEDGSYIYHGRKDDLFKVNGRWVNPIEIENYILQNFRQVDECAISYYLDDDGLAKPVLYLVEKNRTATDVLSEEIQKKLSENFPSYKRPSRIYFIKELTRNSNGKVIRKRLENNLT